MTGNELITNFLFNSCSCVNKEKETEVDGVSRQR